MAIRIASLQGSAEAAVPRDAVGSAAMPAVEPHALCLATKDEIPALAGTLTRAFARDPFISYLAGDAPQRDQRMQSGWTAILRFASARLSDTWTTDDHAGVAIWVPPGRKGSTALGSVRLMPALGRLAGWRRLRSVSEAVTTLERRRHHHCPQQHFGPRRGTGEAGPRHRRCAHAARPGPM